MIIPERKAPCCRHPEQSADADVLLAAPTAVIATPDPLPTPEVVLALAEIDATATPRRKPTPTATPIPTPTLEPLPSSARIENFQHKVQDWKQLWAGNTRHGTDPFRVELHTTANGSTTQAQRRRSQCHAWRVGRFLSTTTHAALVRVNGNPDLCAACSLTVFRLSSKFGLIRPVKLLTSNGTAIICSPQDTMTKLRAS